MPRPRPCPCLLCRPLPLLEICVRDLYYAVWRRPVEWFSPETCCLSFFQKKIHTIFRQHERKSCFCQLPNNAHNAWGESSPLSSPLHLFHFSLRFPAFLLSISLSYARFCTRCAFECQLYFGPKSFVCVLCCFAATPSPFLHSPSPCCCPILQFVHATE